MKRIAKLLDQNFDSSSGKTPQWKSFSRKFRNDFRKEVESINGTLLECSAGHFYMSGFFMHKYQMYYFSISDVRTAMPTFGIDGHAMLIRTATGLKDFTGGINTYQSIKDNMLHDYFKIF